MYKKTVYNVRCISYNCIHSVSHAGSVPLVIYVISSKSVFTLT